MHVYKMSMSIKKLKFGRIMSMLQSNWFMNSVCQKGEKKETKRNFNIHQRNSLYNFDFVSGIASQ